VNITRMPDDERAPISIALSSAQVAAVVRAASHSRTPSVSSLIARALHAPLSDASPADSRSARSRNGAQADMDALALALEDTDPRLSQSLLRGLSILTRFGADGSVRGIVDLARELGMSASTTHRYATTLVQLGLLERCPDTRKYRLPQTL
jgi:IclR helix-turn-helix domain